jgi:hypothetical protein
MIEIYFKILIWNTYVFNPFFLNIKRTRVFNV